MVPKDAESQRSSAKVTPALAASLDSGDWIDAILELQPPDASKPTAAMASRRELIAAAQRAFEEQAVQVRQLVTSSGGTVVDEAWINHTMRVRVPLTCLSALQSSELVAAIDAARPLEVD